MWEPRIRRVCPSSFLHVKESREHGRAGVGGRDLWEKDPAGSHLPPEGGKLLGTTESRARAES